MDHLRAVSYQSLELRRLTRALPILVALLVTLAGASCKSAPADARVILRDFTGGSEDKVLALEIVSRSYVERTQPDAVAPEMFETGNGQLELDLPTEADFYSQKRESAAAKVASDARMQELLKALDRAGFSKRARDGQGPTRFDQGYRKTLEVETAQGVRHFSLPQGAERDALLAHQKMGSIFTQMFNSIYALQSVEPRPIDEVFKQPKISERLRD